MMAEDRPPGPVEPEDGIVKIVGPDPRPLEAARHVGGTIAVGKGIQRVGRTVHAVVFLVKTTGIDCKVGAPVILSERSETRS